MPFSRANRRLTILSIVTVVLAIVAGFMARAGQLEAAKMVLLIFGPVSVIWNNERLASIQRHDLAGPMQSVVLNANEAAVKAEAAVTVTEDTFRKLQADLDRIDKRLNGDLDKRIAESVESVFIKQLPTAVDAALDARLDSFAAKIADRITAPSTAPRVQT